MARAKKENDWTSWALIVFLFAIGVWPVALFLLFSKLFGSDGKRQTASPPPLQTAAPGDRADRARPQQSRAQTAAQKVVRSPATKKSNAKWLKIIGAILLGMGLIAGWDSIDSMYWVGIESYYVWELLQNLAIAAGGGGMLWAGILMDRAVKRYAKYLSVIGDREAMDLGQLARTLGYPEKRVEKDLQKMIDKGYFGGRAYLNVELGYLFRSSKADEDLRRQVFQEEERAEQNRPPKEAEEGYSGILRNIRRANDQIADPVLSAKIDRLEEITARIFRAVEADPKKKNQIDTFLNYYLPTTQKLLDSYAQFESAGVEGENLRQAKSRIESTMDSIIAGFEHQLDQLYKADAMDVDTDIRVMESMLNRDTATVERDFGLGRQTGGGKTADVDLGGAAAQRQED